MTRIILQGFIIVPASDLASVKSELIAHKSLTLQEPGCLTFVVTPDKINPHKFNVYEEFENQTAFESHQARVKSSRWGEITKNVERHYRINKGE
ncbi:putative quinol monooxygenase [Thalassotalea sp. PLHSN55]|uniref:putative quinol monooxygenase n=1 Tax=Thalassotalea sp. PLHSN55 TaxID=3435888 RepID=UPI003F86E686